MELLVFCPNGHVFESRQYKVVNARGITFAGNIEGCAVCGAPSEVMDGTFDFLDGAIRVLLAPSTTLERLERLQLTLRDLLLDDAEPARVVEEITGQDPKLGGFLARQVTPANVLALLAVLIALIGIVIAHVDAKNGGVSQHDVDRLVHVLIEHGAASSPTPTSTPRPTPSSSTTIPPTAPSRPGEE